ncbi:MAG: ATP-binding cassette domain-containing protein, partial [Candidatus Rokubacteria bacterium]|nr:ATP-binding cassette domain-containing protein [Candidatus Rokubacteria bacterium]
RVTPAPAAALPAYLVRADVPAPGAVLARADGVTRRFDDFTAVDRVTLDVRHGRLQALIGPNGAGKTTLFNLLSGLYPPDTGRILLDGRDLTGASPDRYAARGIARSFQITNLFQGLSVWENIRLGVQATAPERFALWRRASDLADVARDTRALLEFLGLEDIEAAPVSSLSYGGQRLLEIGLALTARPRVLLLDEPLAGLAPAERQRIVGLIRLLARQMGVLLVEHDIDRVFEFADGVTVMANGAVLADGTAAEVAADRRVREVYLGSGRRVTAAPRGPAAAGPVLLELEGVNTFYGKSHILHDVSLAARAGEVTALLGRNGAGKSSTLKSIVGLAPPASGAIRFEGRLISGRTPESIARAGVGLVPQGRRLFPGLTVRENLALGRLARSRGPGVRWDDDKIFVYFPAIRARLDTKADQLSGGEQQMVAIARALCGNVKLLLLDEPFEGLAPAVVEDVFRSLDQLRREIPVLIIEHDLDLVLALADRVYVLDRGRVSHEGPAGPLRTDLEFRRRVLWR